MDMATLAGIAVWANILSPFVGIISVAATIIAAPHTPANRLFSWTKRALPYISGVAIGFWIGAFVISSLSLLKYEEQDFTISSRDVEFKSTGMYIRSGDLVEVTFRNTENSWSCFNQDVIKASGYTDRAEVQDDLVDPNAHFCELIGRIGNGTYFSVGSHTVRKAEDTGILYLGMNDVPAKNCHVTGRPDQCFNDNTGNLDIKVTLTRR